MSQSEKVRFAIIGSQQLADKLRRVESESGGELSILSASKETDTARLGLDFGTLFHVIVTAGEAFAFGHLSLELCSYLIQSKDPEIVIETPKGIVRIKKTAGLTPEQVADLI
jgi:hypothetical protein